MVKGLKPPILPYLFIPLSRSLSLYLSMVVFNSVFVQMAGCPISIHYRFLELLIMEQERRVADGNIEESLSLSLPFTFRSVYGTVKTHEGCLEWLHIFLVCMEKEVSYIKI